MLLLDDERKQMISELQEISENLGLIDFLRKYFSHDEYADVFAMEMEERIKIAKNSFSYGHNIMADYDIRKYTFYLLHKFIPAKYGIDCFYVEWKIIKVIIFYEHIIKYLDNREIENEERNVKIKESKDVYDFYKALISNIKCNLSKFSSAIKILKITGLTQNTLDEDKHRCMHEFLAKLIYDNFLIKFIDEYKNYM